MKTAILIVTFRKHFPYLVFALRSVCKYAQGFEEVIISCPQTDQRELDAMIRDVRGFWPSDIPMRPRYFHEWPGKGMLHHMFVILHADCLCPTSDFILHMDSDHIFTGPVTPADYVIDGKADIICAEFDWLISQERSKGGMEPGVRNWQNAGFRALGITDALEFMRRAPLVHYSKVYAQTRADVESHTGEKLEDFMRDQRNRYPQTFAEFQTLGSVAYRKFTDRYNWLRQDRNQWKDGHVRPAWSHRPPTDEDKAKYKELGLGV